MQHSRAFGSRSSAKLAGLYLGYAGTHSYPLQGGFEDTIDSKLTVYENLSEAPMLLEVAPNNGIVLRILSFL